MKNFMLILNNKNNIIYDFSVSKIENTIEMDQTGRNYTIDDRDIDNKEMNLVIQESPLPKINYEDEVSIISSRIETNRKINQNITIDGMISNRKNTLKDESLRILDSLKRRPHNNFVYIEPRNRRVPKDYEWNNMILEHEEFENLQQPINKYTLNSKILPPPDWKKSIANIKKTQSDKKSLNRGKSKECIDAVLSTYRQKECKDLIQENTLKKKRPWSAETNQNKNKQLDISKIQASLRLLKKSINKSIKAASVNDNNENTDNIELKEESNLQITQNTESEANKFKRKSESSKLFKRNSKRATSDVVSSDRVNILRDVTYTPKDLTSRGKENAHVPKLRRIFGSEKMVKQHTKRGYNEMLADSTIIENNENKLVQGSVDPSDVEKSIFDRSTFEDFSYKKYKEFCKNQIKIWQTMTNELHVKGQNDIKKFKDMLNDKKISNNSFELKKRGIEKWISTKKKAIKETKKNFIQILGSMHKFTNELQDIRKDIQSPFESKVNIKNFSLMILDTSINSVGQSKIEVSNYNFEKHVTPIREIENSNRSRIFDGQFQGNSNLSILNSAAKIWQPSHKGHESNMSINSNKCKKALPDKDKHLYSIVPFEYKAKSVIESGVWGTQFKIENSSKFSNKETIVDNNDDWCRDSQKPDANLKHEIPKPINKNLEDEVIEWDYLNISNDSQNNKAVWVDDQANKEIEFHIKREDSKEVVEQKKVADDLVEVKREISYDSPHKSDTDEEWNFKLPSIKSSSGHDNFRNSGSYNNIMEEKKERENESVSVELLEKSPEITMFISEKELSPYDPFCSDHNSHKKSRIAQLRDITNQMYREDNEEDEFWNNVSTKDVDSKRLLDEFQNDENK